MGRQKPKLQPLTDDQQEAVHLLAADIRGQAFAYLLKLEAWTQGTVRKRPDPGDLDPEVARAAQEFLDAVGLRAEEIVMEPYDEDGPPPRYEPDPVLQAENRSRGISAL